MTRSPARWLALLALLGACSNGDATTPPPPPREEEHHDMPEVAAPITQLSEAGPIAEAFLDRAAIASSFPLEEGAPTSAWITLPGPVSRASIWLSTSAGAAAPALEVQAGWSNDQNGPWLALASVWSEVDEHVLAADLETAATRIRFRFSAADLSRVERLWWTANVPLAPEARAADVAEASNALAELSPRSAWSARPARCAAVDGSQSRVTLFRMPGPAAGADQARFLRAAQAFDQQGRHFCDLRASYLVDTLVSFAGRDERRPALTISGSDEGRIAVAVLGCDAPASGEQQTQLHALLGVLSHRHGLSSAAQFEVAPSPACPASSDGAWLNAALETWLATDPFMTEEPPPPPPPTDARVHGRIWDASTGNVTTGTGLAGVTVTCDCGRSATSASDGTWSIDLMAGSFQLTFAKTGFDAQTSALTIAAGADQDLSLGLVPTVTPNPGVSVIDHAFLIDHFGGQVADPFMFPETQDGFQDYLDAVGVVHFAAWEYVVPNNAQVAADCGYTILLPERSMWPKAAALGLLSDQLRDLVAEPIDLRNWWRPACYNAGVGGAAGGDHPDGDAVDLDFRSARSRADAQQYLCETYWKRDIVQPADIAPGSNLNPRLNMSIGLGGITIHLGLLSSNGRRFWKYDSYTTLSASGDCW